MWYADYGKDEEMWTWTSGLDLFVQHETSFMFGNVINIILSRGQDTTLDKSVLKIISDKNPIKRLGALPWTQVYSVYIS